jgi:hypothetical protein
MDSGHWREQREAKLGETWKWGRDCRGDAECAERKDGWSTRHPLPHPRVFWTKSAEVFEKKGDMIFRSAKECARI